MSVTRVGKKQRRPVSLLPRLTAGGVGGLLNGRRLDLDLHLQTRRSLPATRATVLPDDVCDPDHVGGHLEERGEVPHQVVPEELLLGHGGELERDKDDRGDSDLHRMGASHQNLQHLVLLVEVVGSHCGVQFRDILTYSKVKKYILCEDLKNMKL